MPSTFASLRRIVAFSVAVTLVAAPIASAQSREASTPVAAPTSRALLSPSAFARLIQPPADVVPAPAVRAAPRFDLPRSATAATARRAQPTAVKVPQQKSWASRHKTALIVLSAIAVGVAIPWYWCWAGGCED
jgi:hypothetical protein